MTPDEIFAHLEKAFGFTVHGLPLISEHPPGLFQFRVRATERRINDAIRPLGKHITNAMRLTFWREIRKGQDVYEDAGGYCWRCWCAALGLPFHEAGLPYKTVTEDELLAALQRDFHPATTKAVSP